MSFLKKDSIGFGLFMGIIIPAVLFIVLLIPSMLLAPESKDYLVPISTLLLVAIFPNLFLMRYYLMKLNLDRTGRGILIATFVLAIVYFIYYLKIVPGI